MAQAIQHEERGKQTPYPTRVSGGLLVILVSYLIAIILSETLTAFGIVDAGMLIHFVILFILLIHASVVLNRNPKLSKFLTSLTLAPILRILSLSLPMKPFSTIIWLGIISVPLIIACFATISVLGFKARDVGLRLGSLKHFPLQILVACSGIILGFVEFIILSPSSWIDDGSFLNFTIAILVIFLATGLLEELMFRGILQRTATELTGDWGILYVSLLFAALHISFLSIADMIFVFLVAMFFALVVRKTGSIIGVVVAHTLVNTMLYRVLPK